MCPRAPAKGRRTAGLLGSSRGAGAAAAATARRRRHRCSASRAAAQADAPPALRRGVALPAPPASALRRRRAPGARPRAARSARCRSPACAASCVWRCAAFLGACVRLTLQHGLALDQRGEPLLLGLQGEALGSVPRLGARRSAGAAAASAAISWRKRARLDLERRDRAPSSMRAAQGVDRRAAAPAPGLRAGCAPGAPAPSSSAHLLLALRA